MKCETNLQLHEALGALIEGSTGTERAALIAIREYTDERLPTIPTEGERRVAEIIAGLSAEHHDCGRLPA
ncbi:hypothetical protein FACS1894190_14690 [Spirochaetia bacterium]|nr:hypothetical protein FACS1894190_14690 [Spirochaetia bacterium]